MLKSTYQRYQLRFTYSCFRDRKKKKFVGQSGNQGKGKKIKTESGQWINASYKSDAYQVINGNELNDLC